jgi:6-pyruvoyl-tetrahydropterin synthase
MKLATLKWSDRLIDYDAKLVNFVHDEWQVECPNNMNIALSIANMMADSLVQVGEDLSLNCPLAGSFYNEDLKDYTIATNWAYTH